MKILLVGTSFSPTYGGPAVSVSRLGQGLARIGAEVALWAPDGTATNSPLIANELRLRSYSGSLGSTIQAFGLPDLIHDNGIWLRHNHTLADLANRKGIPRIVSLRGMLEPWALEHRGSKKAIAWLIYQRRDLLLAARLHATADTEAENLHKLGLSPSIVIIPNGVDMPAHCTKVSGKPQRTALFLSRLHPKKGLPMLLEAWASQRPTGWRLKIAGPDEGGHSKFVAALVQKLGLGGDVDLLGPVYGVEKDELFRSSNLFVLPTFSENFGLVVAEALSHGVPVLTTTGTPWHILAEKDCGWWVEPTTLAIQKALQRATELSTKALAEMGERGRAFVAENLGWQMISRRFLDVYKIMSINKTRHNRSD